MCGFAGLFLRAPNGPDESRAQVRAMADRLHHRGPDDEGTWSDEAGRVAFGFRRLSILDLSPLGHQPMISPSGRYAMVFNGEVYNFQTLRTALGREGATFRGGSDSEVILSAFDRWGVERTLPQTIGMFAIALWDRERSELVLIRDRMGIKPLYVARTARGFAFGSELAPLMVSEGFDRTLDRSAIEAYLRYLYVPAPRTPFRSVQKLLPGHAVRIGLGNLGGEIPEGAPFWSLEGAREAGWSELEQFAAAMSDSESGIEDRKTDELEALLSDAVRLRMIADVPVGALLSGGIDSSTVVALMRQHTPHAVRTYTIGFDQAEHDESAHARAIARHLGTEHTEVMLTGRDALDLVPALPRIFDEPLADPSQIPTYLVSQLARREVTVALSGDGGDELFAGYNRYTSGRDLIPRLSAFPSPLRTLAGSAIGAVPSDAWDRLYAMTRGGEGGIRLAGPKAIKVGRLLRCATPAQMYRSLLSTWDDPERLLAGGRAAPWDPVLASLPSGASRLTLGDMMFSDQRYYLADDLLQKVDRASMAVSLEVRVPILDHRVVEFSWTVPDSLKIRDGKGKWLLRQVLYRHVPRELVERPKVGFSVPVDGWLRGALRPWAEELIFGNPIGGGEPLLDARAVQDRWRGFLAGRTEHALGLWAVVMLEAWRKHWGIDGALGDR